MKNSLNLICLHACCMLILSLFTVEARYMSLYGDGSKKFKLDKFQFFMEKGKNGPT